MDLRKLYGCPLDVRLTQIYNSPFHDFNNKYIIYYQQNLFLFLLLARALLEQPPSQTGRRRREASVVASMMNDFRIGTPVGWACYTDKVDIARHLVKLGASPEKTTETLWNHGPPLLAAAEHGKLNAAIFLVEECGLSITVKWNGHGINDHVKMSPNWEEMADHSAVMKYAKVMLKRARK